MTHRSKQLGELISGLETLGQQGDRACPVTGLKIDSRRVSPGDVFVAIEGNQADGHRFLSDAAKRGAVAAVVSKQVDPAGFHAVVRVVDTREALAWMAAAFWDHPSADFELIGITGTNGKTTLSYLLEHVFEMSGGSAGIVGTVSNRFRDQVEHLPHTTPEAPDLQALFHRMKQAGVSHVAMEVSSHALSMHRARACHFRSAVFTNLSRDHLDYHGDLDRYAAAKSLLFSRELVESKANRKVAVANRDDPRWRDMLSNWPGPVITFGEDPSADVHPLGTVTDSLDGFRAQASTPDGEVGLTCHLPGRHNLHNTLAALAAAISVGIPAAEAAQGVAACKCVPGRLERVRAGVGPHVFVDYAHTDQALANVLLALRPLTPGRLVVVFGCGGDRDRGKRPLMGSAVAGGADLAVVTSDNPRTEDPQAIVQQILPGLTGGGFSLVEPGTLSAFEAGYFAVVPDRQDAIRLAVALARPADVVLVAGKGHEDYQIVGRERRSFDDREEARKALELREVRP